MKPIWLEIKNKHSTFIQKLQVCLGAKVNLGSRLMSIALLNISFLLIKQINLVWIHFYTEGAILLHYSEFAKCGQSQRQMILWSSWCLAGRWMHKQAALTSRSRPVSIPLQADLHPRIKKAHLFVCKCDDVILNSLLLQLLQLFRGSFSVEGLCLHQCCICIKDSPQHYKVSSA